MNIQLYINNQLADLAPDTQIVFSHQFQDSEQFVVKDVEYSYEFVLPTSLNNKKIFDFQDLPDQTDKFTRIYEAKLFVNDKVVIDGNLLLNEVDFKGYSVNIYTPNQTYLSDVLGDVKLSEIKPHEFSVSNYADITAQNRRVSDFIKSGRDIDPHVCFPLCLYGATYNSDKYNELTDNKEFLSAYLNTSKMSPDNIFPAFNVLSVIRDCFETFGLSVSGNVFTNPKFTWLYETFRGNADDWKNRDIAYHLKMSGSFWYYNNGRKTDKQSKTMEVNADGDYSYAQDRIFKSNNHNLLSIDDAFHMVKQTPNGEGTAVSVTIPKAGWYQVRLQTSLYIGKINGLDRYHGGGDGSLPIITGRYAMGGASIDNCDLNNRVYEIHLTHGDVTSEGQITQYLTFPVVSPLTDIVYNENDILASNTNYFANFYIKEDLYQRYIKGWRYANKSTVPLYSGNYGQSLIACASFGRNFVKGIHADFFLHNANKKYVLQNILNNPQMVEIKGVQFRNLTSYDAVTYPDQCLVIVPRNSYTNQDNNVTVKNYAGQNDCTINRNAVDGNQGGKADIYTCVWLEEGEYIGLDIVSPYLNNKDEWKYDIITGEISGKGRNNGGVPNVFVTYDLEIGFVSHDKEWTPTDREPIPARFDAKQTNVNAFLGDMKANDYVENFLKTFHLQLRKVGDKSYTIDYVNQDANLYTNEINLDKCVCLEDVKFRKVNLNSSLNLQWSVDVNERGFVNGDHLYLDHFTEDIQKSDYSHTAEYRGDYTMNNELNTSGKVVNYKSEWSYTWMEYVKILEPHNPTTFPQPYDYETQTQCKFVKVPILADSKNFKLSSAKIETGKTARLFYPYNRFVIEDKIDIRREPMLQKFETYKWRDSVSVDYITVQDPTTWVELILCDTNLYSYPVENGERVERCFMLDYNNAVSNTLGKNTTMTEVWNPALPTYYECVVDALLSIEDYMSMRANSRMVLNGNVYRLVSVDGWNCVNTDKCEIVLMKEKK